MNSLRSYAETLEIGQTVAQEICDNFPGFDIKQADLVTMLKTGKGNCFTESLYYGVRMGEMGVTAAFQQSVLPPRRRHFPHARVLLPCDDNQRWGVLIDFNSVSRTQFCFARSFDRTPAFRERDLEILAKGEAITMTEPRIPGGFETQNFDAGIAHYQERAGISPSIIMANAALMVGEWRHANAQA